MDAEMTERVREQQQHWAESRELDLDETGCLRAIDANLVTPLSTEARDQLRLALPQVLGDGEKPGELCRIDSRWALVCNVFEPWRGRPLTALSAACGADPEASEIRLADPCPGASEPADLALGGPCARPTLVVSSFAETGAGDRIDSDALASTERWSGLAGCRGLALDLRANPRRFRHLPANRLLTQAAARTQTLGTRGFRLLYLWYEHGGNGRFVRQEIDRFRMRIGGEVDFSALSWHALFEELRWRLLQPGRRVSYLDYLAGRYFPC
jgi:hypothetical protein